MQTRLTTLETKWDTVIPTLATREDLLALEGRLRDEMRHGFIDLQRWLMSAMQRWLLIVLAIVVASVGGGAGVMFSKRSSSPPSYSTGTQTDRAMANEARLQAKPQSSDPESEPELEPQQV